MRFTPFWRDLFLLALILSLGAAPTVTALGSPILAPEQRTKPALPPQDLEPEGGQPEGEELGYGPSALSWQIETVDSAGAVGHYGSLALDNAGRPHISYYSFDSGGILKYAYHDGAAWRFDIVDDPAAGVGYYTSLSLDSSGRPRISYYDVTNGDLKYAYLSGTVWFKETVDSAGDVGYYTSLDLDTAGRPHISYLDNTNRDLKYAYKGGTGWYLETVDSAGWVGYYTSIALDTADRPHVSYHYGNPGFDLKYAYHNGTIWVKETVTEAGNVGWYTSLCLDAAGRPHISYYDYSYATVKYASYVGAGGNCGPSNDWQCETLDFVGSEGGYTSLALDGLGRPYISYYFGPTGDLKVAYYVGENGNCGPSNTWQCETVDSTGNVGRYSSIAVDTDYVVHISYSDQTNYDLKYARGCRPVDGVTITGPDLLLPGEPGLYTAAYSPLNATRPVTLTWDDGTTGPSAIYSWSTLGVHTITVTATNPCGEVSETYTVTVCQPAEEVEIGGPDFLPVNTPGTYTASYSPPNANQPVELTWDNGATGPSALYSWATPGVHTIIVTATNLCAEISATLAVTVCQPVEEVEVSGPAYPPVGEPAAYSADYLPPNASPPVTLEWDNGTIGPSAVYSWTTPGPRTIAVTATNPCAEIPGTLPVIVCQPVEDVSIDGPDTLFLDDPGTYTASYLPANATSPLTLEWDNGTIGPTAVYSWSTPGVHTITATATNPCAEISGTFTVTTTACRPVQQISLDGPDLVLVGAPERYTATTSPSDATPPVTLEWDNGTVGPTAVYSWTSPGLHTITITATNPCRPTRQEFEVSVCQPVNEAGIVGPSVLLVGETGTYTATFGPPDATAPITFTWNNGSTGPTADYGWSVLGSYPITVNALNACGQAQGEISVVVFGEVYLPLVVKYWNPCHIGPGGLWETEDNDSRGQANGPLCSGMDYYARPDDAWDVFYFLCGVGPVEVRVWDYVPGARGQLFLYDGDTQLGWQSSCEGGCAISSNTLDGGMCYMFLYTDPLFTTTQPYSLRATFQSP